MYLNFSFKKNAIGVSVCGVCACVLVCSCLCEYPQRPQECVRSPRVRVTGACESPDIGARNRTQALCKKVGLVFWSFETGFLCVALAVLELVL